MLYLVSYDIPQEFNPIRTRVARILKNWGLERLQYSVFIGYLTRNEAETISMEIKEILHGAPADIRIIPICKNCQKATLIVSVNPYLEGIDEGPPEVTFL